MVKGNTGDKSSGKRRIGKFPHRPLNGIGLQTQTDADETRSNAAHPAQPKRRLTEDPADGAAGSSKAEAFARSNRALVRDSSRFAVYRFCLAAC
jgi:hypothetical protein